MSFLAPFYLLGLLAVSLPFVLHFIRRVPRGRYEFSSLMFLTPSPPRLTRRSRLDHLLLLLLRILALSILALAFARPFLREAIDLAMGQDRGRQVAILVDTSASMQRDGLWEEALERVDKVLDDLEPADDVALYTFADELTPLVPFADKPQADKSQKRTLVRRQLREQAPTWAATDLGAAMVTVADVLQVVQDQQPAGLGQQVVVVSDFQQGADIASLQANPWPADLPVLAEVVAPSNPSNAAVRLLVQDDSQERGPPRVRVTNSPDSTTEQFTVAWGRPNGDVPDKGAVAVYVPPGQSRIIRVPRPAQRDGADRLMLAGDGCEFDNRYYDVPPRFEDWSVLYLGSDEVSDPEGLHYYLQRALRRTPYGNVTISASRDDISALDLPATAPRLVVVSESLEDSLLEQLQRYARDGGSLLLVPATREAARKLVTLGGKARLIDDGPEEELDEGPDAKTDYVMLTEIDFTHPVFASMAGPRYSDFTGIHFWKHFAFELEDDDSVRVLARFDSGDPALWEQDYGDGQVFVLASGWRPKDSQLALSSKFVPLLAGVLERAAGRLPEFPSYAVREQVSFVAGLDASQPPTVRKPDGTYVESSANAESFRDTDLPGIYQISQAGKSYSVAVNLDASESMTAPLDVERLEQFGVRLGRQPAPSEEAERERQLRDVELEGRQQIWRWLVLFALGLLLFETWWAGQKARRAVAAALQGE